MAPEAKELTFPLRKGLRYVYIQLHKIYGGVYDRFHERNTNDVLLNFRVWR